MTQNIDVANLPRISVNMLHTLKLYGLSCCNIQSLAKFLQLPDRFKDFAGEYFGTMKINGKFLAHCQRELTHEQWKIILDDEFIHAYEHGLVIECCDGLMRRFYPRIFSYSADYKEK